MTEDTQLRVLSVQLAVSFNDGRPASIEDVVDTACAFYDFLTADFGEEEGDEDEAAPDNAQTYAN